MLFNSLAALSSDRLGVEEPDNAVESRTDDISGL